MIRTLTVAVAAVVMLLAGIGALALLPSAAAVAQDENQVTLAFKFTPGETTKWRLTEVASEVTTDASEAVEQKQTTTIVWQQKVEKVEGDVATLTLTYQSVVYEQETSLNSATPVKFDSTNPEDMQRAESDLALKPFAALVGGSFTVKLKPTGEVVAVEGYTAMLDRMFEGLNDEIFLQLKGALKAQFSDEAMKDQLGQLWRILPDNNPVKAGARWNRLLSQPVMFVGKLQADQEFRLESVSKDGEGENAPLIGTINVNTIYNRVDDGSADPPPGADALEGFRISGTQWGGEQKGSIEFNVGAGRIRKSTLKTTMNVNLEATSTSMAETTKLTWTSRITSTVTLEPVKD